MEIRHLNTFLQVAVMQNFTKAAEFLGYSQANVSLQIRQLESDIGVPLFDRIGKKASLTQFGQMLVPYAQQIVSTATQIENLFQLKNELSGTIRIGFVESLFECLFCDTVSKYHEQFPNVTVEVEVDSTTELLKKLHTSQLDVVCLIDNNIIDPDICYWGTKQCNMAVVANPNHPLSGKENLSLHDLDGQEFVLMENTAPYIVDFNRILLKENVQISAFLNVQSPEAALKLISKSNYLSVLPDYSIKKAVQQGSVTQLRLSGFSSTQTVQFLIHKNKVITPQIEGFLEEAYSTFLDYVME